MYNQKNVDYAYLLWEGLHFQDYEQAEEEVQHLPDWFQKPTRLPSPDHAWNTSVPAIHESVQPWLSNVTFRIFS
ncbi:hypothetical protein Tco_0406458 [Tanacetum coccineum]